MVAMQAFQEMLRIHFKCLRSSSDELDSFESFCRRSAEYVSCNYKEQATRFANTGAFRVSAGDNDHDHAQVESKKRANQTLGNVMNRLNGLDPRLGSTSQNLGARVKFGISQGGCALEKHSMLWISFVAGGHFCDIVKKKTLGK